MKRTILILAVFALSGCAHWSTADKFLATTFVIGQGVNYGQTREALISPEYYEMNPMLAEMGEGHLLLWKVVSTAGVLWIADRVDEKWRKWVLGGANLVVWGCVAHDTGIGVGWRF